VFGLYIILNLFLAILLDGFSGTAKRDAEERQAAGPHKAGRVRRILAAAVQAGRRAGAATYAWAAGLGRRSTDNMVAKEVEKGSGKAAADTDGGQLPWSLRVLEQGSGKGGNGSKGEG
jgi:hypothetical protein